MEASAARRPIRTGPRVPGRLLRLASDDKLVELRVAPERLTDEIAEFIEDCWRPRPAQRAPRRAARR